MGLLNRSTPSIAGATMSIPADLMMCPSSAFQRFVNLSMGYAIYTFEKQYT